MSKRQHERKEKICLNCGSEIYGRYCHVCGQENVEPKESFGHLVRHFFEDITHFDGKFFITLKYLLFKPGFLSKEYIAGKRVRYLHPIRMYVFTSFIFFLIFFLVNKNMIYVNDSDDSSSKKFYTKSELKDIKLAIDLGASHERVYYSTKLDLQKQSQILQNILDTLKDNDSIALDLNKISTQTLKEYDFLENSLPKEKRDNFFLKKLKERSLLLEKKYQNSDSEFKALSETFQHKIPQLLFISLPIFALLLMLLFHKRKDLYYTDHAIFSIHLYIAYFIFLLIIVLLTLLPDSDFLSWIILAFLLLVCFYTYKALKNFYHEGRWKTIFKVIILWFLHLFVLIILFLSFAFFLFFTI